MPMLPMAPPQGGMDPMMQGGGVQGMGPVALPPVPAEQAGVAAMSLVPGQQAAQAALTQQQRQELVIALLGQLAGGANPDAEGALSEPSPQVAPGMGGPLAADESMGMGGGY